MPCIIIKCHSTDQKQLVVLNFYLMLELARFNYPSKISAISKSLEVPNGWFSQILSLFGMAMAVPAVPLPPALIRAYRAQTCCWIEGEREIMHMYILL